MEPVEQELKLETEGDAIERIKSLPSVKDLLRGEPQSRHLRSVYFDTPDLALYRAGLTLRVRDDGEEHTQTVKTSGTYERGEWEQKIGGSTPERQAVKGSPLEPLMACRKFRESLRPVFETRVHRTVFQLDDGKSEMEMAFDLGDVSAGERSTALNEVELELKRGDPSRLFALAKKLNGAASLRLGVASKAERGYALLREERPSAVKAGPIALRPGMSSAEAFQSICRSCLDHLMRNEPVFRRTGDPEALHQMRVALRRLRAALSLFKKVVTDDRRDQIDGALRNLVHQLNAARDSDQFLEKTMRPVLEEHSGEPGLRELNGYFEKKREQAFTEARQAVDSRNFRDLILDTEYWLRAGDWLDSAESREPIEKQAGRILKAGRRKLAKKGRHLERLSDAERHKARIAAKKLRYGIQFFATLWPGGKRNERRDALLDTLQRMQDDLGDLHDISVARETLEELAKTPGELTFAAGLLVGLQASRQDPLTAAACGDYDSFTDAKPFWP